MNLKRKRAVGKQHPKTVKRVNLQSAKEISRRNKWAGMVAQHPTGAKM